MSWEGDVERLRLRWDGLEGEEELNLRGGSMIGGDEDLETGMDMACKPEEELWLPTKKGVTAPGAVLDPRELP